FGDNSSADIANPSHYYTHPGTYKLSLKVQGFGNCMDSVSKTILVKGPTGTLSFSPDTVCTKEQVQFHATAPANSTIFWDFSDGITMTSQTTSNAHRYESPGLYHPRMILIDTAGCQVPVESPDILTVMGVRARIGKTGTLFCDSAILQFRDSSVILNDAPLQFKWKFSDGSVSTQRNPIHIFRDTGVFMTYLTVISAAGCTDSIAAPNTIQIVGSPFINIESKNGVCQFDSIQFSGTSKSENQALSWRWIFPEGKSSSLQNPSESFSSQGNHLVTAVAMNRSGCADTANINILVHPLPQVNAGTDTMICRGQSYILDPKGATGYKWQNDPSLTVMPEGLAVARPTERVVYYLTGTSEFGCKGSGSVTVQVMQPFTVTVSQPDTMCAGQSVQLRAEGAAKYQWYPDESLNNAGLSNPIAKPLQTTDYIVIASDGLKCFSDTGHVRISVFPVPKFSIAETAITVPAGTDLPIHTSSSEDVNNWKWYPSKGLSCDTCPEPVLHGTENTTYTAVAGNNGGCTATDKLTVTVVCNGGNLFIPNTFSPNNDGMNDIFYPRGKGVSTIRSMRIFNRWGDIVFEKNNFSANDPDAGWNGMFKGSILTPDVFVYTVDVICENSTVFTLKGNVTLVR
ncbi:MAG TPA: PKD domain-containing protein, partial [Chitinophagaceae bacterium]